MSKFSKHQPKDGETVLHCGHLEDKPHHFFAMSDPSLGEPEEVTFNRPDGSTGRARWMVLCSTCNLRHGQNPSACIRADATWIGDEPAIKENVQ